MLNDGSACSQTLWSSLYGHALATSLCVTEVDVFVLKYVDGKRRSRATTLLSGRAYSGSPITLIWSAQYLAVTSDLASSH